MADSELAELRKQCITSLYLCTDNISKYLGSEKDAEFNKLKKYVEGYCTLEAQQEVVIQALEKAKAETNTSNIDTIEQRFEKHLSNLAGKRLKVDRHPFMIELNKRIAKGQERPSQDMNESDLAITESMDQHIDPITKRPITDPVKNKLCGHIYEKQSITNLIQRNKRTRCPVVGCGNREPLQMGHLTSDEELRFRMTITQHSNMHSTMLPDRSIMDLDNSQ